MSTGINAVFKLDLISLFHFSMRHNSVFICTRTCNCRTSWRTSGSTSCRPCRTSSCTWRPSRCSSWRTGRRRRRRWWWRRWRRVSLLIDLVFIETCCSDYFYQLGQVHNSQSNVTSQSTLSRYFYICPFHRSSLFISNNVSTLYIYIH